MPQQPQAFDPNEFGGQAFDPNEFAPAGPAPDPEQMSDLERTVLGLPPKQTSWWDTAASYIPSPVKSAWEWASAAPEFIAKPVAEKAMEFSEWINPERAADYSPRSLISAYAESLGNVVPSLASPLNLATMGSFGAAGTAAKYGLPTAARGLTNVGRGLSVPVAAQGAYNISQAENLPEALLGGVELAGGVMGARAKVPQAPKPIPTPEVLPVRQPAAPITDAFQPAGATIEQLPVRPAPIEAAPQQVFDPSTLVGLERTGTAGETMHWAGRAGRQRPTEINFVDPATGEIRPASQAKPGDVPIIPEEAKAPVTNQQMFERSAQLEQELRPPTPFEQQVLPPEFQPDIQLVNEPIPQTGGTAPRVVTPEATPQAAAPKGTFIDWLNDLAKGESGELDVDALLGRRAEPETPARRVDPETVSRENRTFIDRLADRDIQDFIVRQGRLPGYQTEVGQGILNYARDVLDNRVRGIYPEGSPVEPRQAVRMAQEERAALIEPETGRPFEPYEGPYPPVREELPPELPGKPGRSLEEVEAGKRTPALQRLGKLIGEERAGQLASGERAIEFAEKPYRPQKGKRLSRDTVKSWGEWGDSTVREYDPDPARPGLSVEPHNISNMFPDAFGIVYRDAQGNPIGVLRTDLQGKGIDTLAVRSDLGLRRGKVAFEMLKEAFDRGISEPSGTTSDLTKNLIERVKRLVSSEGGEFDADVVIDTVNKLISAISKSRVGQAVGKFVKGEGGEVDLDRLRALFRKQQQGALTPEELVEARTMAKEYQASRPPGKPLTESVKEMGLPPEQEAAAYKGILERNAPGTEVTESLAKRLQTETGGGPRPPRKPPALLDESQLNPDVPIVHRKPPAPGIEQSMLSQVWNAPRSLQSIDLPGITSAALRQSRPLAFTSDWFKSWNSALKSFSSKEALDAINAKISNSKYFRSRYQPVMDRAGNIVKYIEKPSIAEELGVKMTDVIHHREEAIVSSLAEKIPGYGRYVKASNRAYTGFLNDLRAAKFEQLMDGAKALGRDPEIDVVLGKKIADFVNNATGRGSLKYLGDKVNLEPISDVLGAALYSPRALSARLAFMNPANYTVADPFIRKQYWSGLARIGVSWGAASGLASLMPGVHVSMDPNNADFGKIRIGNTRIDPGAGFQQLLVLANRELPQVLGGGGTASSTGKPGQPGKFVPFGSTPMSATRLSLAGRYLYNQLNPSLRFVFDMLSATRKEPFDLTDRSLQAVLPMYVADIAEAAKGDSTVAEFFAPLLSSMGTGVQTYERGSFNKPQITPFIEQVTGVGLPTAKIGGR